MLCVPVDEEIPEVSDSVVKAITGESHAAVLIPKVEYHLIIPKYFHIKNMLTPQM